MNTFVVLLFILAAVAVAIAILVAVLKTSVYIRRHCTEMSRCVNCAVTPYDYASDVRRADDFRTRSGSKHHKFGPTLYC